MYKIYLDGTPLSDPFDELYTVIEAETTIEVGAAGSLEFSVPVTNPRYNDFNKMTSIVTVEEDGIEIFRGRPISHAIDFQKNKKIYCEGCMGYLLDTVQQPVKFEGTISEYFRKLVDGHNEMIENYKQFQVGVIEVEDRNIRVSGQTDPSSSGDPAGPIDYKQIIIDATANDWLTTHDLITQNILNYTGGYLRVRRSGEVNYLDIVDRNELPDSDRLIEFGKNLLDLTEEGSAEGLYTVLIGICVVDDKNITYKLEDEEAIAIYGVIYKTHVFNDCYSYDTLVENTTRMMNLRKNVPITFTAKAIDLHKLYPDLPPITAGDTVIVTSPQHFGFEAPSRNLLCTKVEIPHDNPANIKYTFGNPIQTLTDRYRREVAPSGETDVGEAAEVPQVQPEKAHGGGGGGGGGAAAAAKKVDEDTKETFEEWMDIDPANPDGIGSLGGLYKKVKDNENIIQRTTGINFNAPQGELNIYAMQNEIDKNSKTLSDNLAQIDLISNELQTSIRAFADYQVIVDGKLQTYAASLDLFTGELNGVLEAHANLAAEYGQNFAALEQRVTDNTATVNLVAQQGAANRNELKMLSDEVGANAALLSETAKGVAGIESLVMDDTGTAIFISKAEYGNQMSSIIQKVDSMGTSITLKADRVSIQALEFELANVNKFVVSQLETMDLKVHGKLDINELDAEISKLDLVAVNSMSIGNLLWIHGGGHIDADAYGSIKIEGSNALTEKVGDERYVVKGSDLDIGNYYNKTESDARYTFTDVQTDIASIKLGNVTWQVSRPSHTHSQYALARDIPEIPDLSTYYTKTESDDRYKFSDLYSGYVNVTLGPASYNLSRSNHNHDDDYAEKDHTHSKYETAISSLTSAVLEIQGILANTSHRHSVTINKHTHSVTISGPSGTYTTTNVAPTVSNNGYTGYASI